MYIHTYVLTYILLDLVRASHPEKGLTLDQMYLHENEKSSRVQLEWVSVMPDFSSQSGSAPPPDVFFFAIALKLIVIELKFGMTDHTFRPDVTNFFIFWSGQVTDL